MYRVRTCLNIPCRSRRTFSPPQPDDILTHVSDWENVPLEHLVVVKIGEQLLQKPVGFRSEATISSVSPELSLTETFETLEVINWSPLQLRVMSRDRLREMSRKLKVPHNPSKSKKYPDFRIQHFLPKNRKGKKRRADSTTQLDGDWLQEPHVYALYESYGMSKHQIEILFIAGFGSSLLFGTVVGSFADKFGRRNNCILYALLYGGAFANSLIAILSGAQFVADAFGFVAPFDLGIFVLVVMGLVTMSTWNENYGNEKAAVQESFAKAIDTIKSDVNVLCLGLVQALFEGSMYTFVLEWTPALTLAAGEGGSIPHGYIFAAFMVATMMGFSIFKIISAYTRPEDFMRYVLLLSAVCLSVPVVAPTSGLLLFGAFILFEVCVGIFWPSMGCLRGAYLPEETRSTTINLFPGDWLQEPHVYALYESYGMSKHQIEILFIAGFGSSLLFGTVVGSFADKFGRRNNCILYALLYGGAFANSLIAILSGAQFVADAFGFVAPFDLGIFVLVVMGLVTMSTWNENYGNEKAAVQGSFAKAIDTIKSDVNVLCLGLVQALFEGSMYTFVLEWTPALTLAAGEGGSIPHGYIFAAFMVATMMGSSIFKIISAYTRPEDFMRYVLLLSAVCLSVPVVAPTSGLLLFGAFILFEVCVGIFWPSMGCLRGAYLPEETRSTTINLFRIPLNLMVVFILLQKFFMLAIFKFCVLFLLLAAGAQHVLYSRTSLSILPEKLPPSESDMH